MVTLHPFVYYYKDEGKICHGNFVLISDCNTYDTVAVHLFQRRLINHLQDKFQFLSNIVYFSDGCASPSDGIGRTLKCEVTKASLQRPYKDQILIALDIFHFVESSLNSVNAEFLTCIDW